MTKGANDVVVTGVGVVSPFGVALDDYWNALEAGRRGITKLSAGGERVFHFGAVPPLSRDQVEGSLSRAATFACLAAREAVNRAAVDLSSLPADRVAFTFGTCQNAAHTTGFDGGQVAADQAPAAIGSEVRRERGVAAAVASYLRVRGPRLVVNTACAASTTAIGLGCDLIRTGDVDVAVCGGSDELSFAAMYGMQAIAVLDSEPCAPYSRSGGTTLGEGAAFIILESGTSAARRGVVAMASVLGFGSSADAVSLVVPDRTGAGALLAVERALADAGVGADAVDYINGHGTGTTSNDDMEREVLRRLLGDRRGEVPVSSTKSMIGHAMGAAGALETAACVFAVHRDVAPPTAGFDGTADEEFDFVPDRARAHRIDVSLNVNYGFGGNNAALVIAKPERVRQSVVTDDAPVAVITGIGAVGPLGVGRNAWWAALDRGECCLGNAVAAQEQEVTGVAPLIYALDNVDPRRWRRMDDLGRLCVTSVALAVDDAGLEFGADEGTDVAVVLGTEWGPQTAVEAFFAAMHEGKRSAMPVLFPNTPFNSSAGHVCITFRFRGPTTTFVSGGVSSALALKHATDLIAMRRAEVVIVVGGDVLSDARRWGRPLWPVTRKRVRPFDVASTGTAHAEAAVAVVLESQDHARQRSARAHSRVAYTAVASGNNLASPVDALSRAMTAAIHHGGARPTDIGCCVAAAPGIRWMDAAEATAIASAVGRSAVITAPKSLYGETAGASGLAGVVVGSHALATGSVTPTVGLDEPLHEHPLAYATEPTPWQPTYCLANSVAHDGVVASVLLASPEELYR